MALHETGIFSPIIKVLAAVMPMLWQAKEKLRAADGKISNNKVKTGNATAPPPSELAPAIKEPNTMVSGATQLILYKLKALWLNIYHSHVAITTTKKKI